MGTTFGSLHIYASEQNDLALQSTVRLIREKMLLEGFVEVDSIEQRDSIVVIMPSKLWVSIYGWHLSYIHEAVVFFSNELHSIVLSIEAHDSDVATVGLYENGQKLDTYSNWINYDNSPALASGNAEKWRPILSAGISVDDLSKAWLPDKTDYPFEAEGILRRIVNLLQLDAQLIWEEQKAAEVNGAVRLAFRDTQVQPYDIKAEGLPKFERMGYTSEVATKANERFQISLDCRNSGGALKGIGVDISGSAIDNRLVDLYGFQHQGETVTPEQRVVGGSKHFQLWFRSNELPAGIRDMDAYYKLVQKSPSHGELANRKFYETMFSIHIEGHGLKIGGGMIVIRMMPLENPDDGAFTHTIPVSIFE